MTSITKLNQKLYEKGQIVARVAHDYQQQYPDLAWSECIRLAEQHVGELTVTYSNRKTKP